jgi:integrase/recombinase XerC
MTVNGSETPGCVPRDDSKVTTLRMPVSVYLEGFEFFLRARNLSPSTIRVARETLNPLLARMDPLDASRLDVQRYLGSLQARCQPATVWTAWRHLRAFFAWLEAEGDIARSPMASIPRPMVPPTEVSVLTAEQVTSLLEACRGRGRYDRRDHALIAVMVDTGLRLAEVSGLTVDDIGAGNTIRVFGKGRKWRTVVLGSTSSNALHRWLRIRGAQPGPLWLGRRGPLGPSGIRRVIQRRGRLANLEVHPHMLRHTFVDLWLRNGGSEVDLARLCGWTSTRMAEVYARHRADERALAAHTSIRPLDSLL